MLPEFLNVDLEIESGESLDAIAQEFGDRVHVLHNGPYQEMTFLLALEIYAGDDEDPESVIEAFCDLIEGLTGKAKKAWQKARARRFDIGIESGTEVPKQRFTPLCLALSTDTLARLASIGGEVVITVYPPAPKVVRAVAKAKKKTKKK
jgi:hypothetical protein